MPTFPRSAIMIRLRRMVPSFGPNRSLEPKCRPGFYLNWNDYSRVGEVPAKARTVSACKVGLGPGVAKLEHVTKAELSSVTPAKAPAKTMTDQITGRPASPGESRPKHAVRLWLMETGLR